MGHSDYGTQTKATVSTKDFSYCILLCKETEASAQLRPQVATVHLLRITNNQRNWWLFIRTRVATIKCSPFTAESSDGGTALHSLHTVHYPMVLFSTKLRCSFGNSDTTPAGDLLSVCVKGEPVQQVATLYRTCTDLSTSIASSPEIEAHPLSCGCCLFVFSASSSVDIPTHLDSLTVLHYRVARLEARAAGFPHTKIAHQAPKHTTRYNHQLNRRVPLHSSPFSPLILILQFFCFRNAVSVFNDLFYSIRLKPSRGTLLRRRASSALPKWRSMQLPLAFPTTEQHTHLNCPIYVRLCRQIYTRDFLPLNFCRRVDFHTVIAVHLAALRQTRLAGFL